MPKPHTFFGGLAAERRSALALAAVLGACPQAHAEAEVVVAAGAAIQVLQYQEAYGSAGGAIDSGIELMFRGRRAHRLRLDAQLVGFPSDGAQLWLGSLEAGWRWYPLASSGLHCGVAAGLLLSYERFELALAPRRIEDSRVRLGAPLAATVGWTLGDRLDVDVTWKQVVFVGDDPRTVGYGLILLGWRFR